MPTPKKAKQIKQMETWNETAKAQIFADYRGLTVREMMNLRRKLTPTGTEFHVVKNTLYLRSWGESAPEGIEDVTHGPTAVAYVSGDEAAAAKALVDFANETKKMSFKAALLSGQIVSAEKVEALAKLPSREVLIAKTMGTMLAPGNKLAATLNESIARLARALQAYADQKSA